MDTIVLALQKVIAKDLQTSGNLENRVRDLQLEVVMELADAYYDPKKDEPEDIFALGLELGREADNDIVYYIDLDSHHVFFRGTEADIIRRLPEAPISDEDGQKTVEDLERELTDV